MSQIIGKTFYAKKKIGVYKSIYQSKPTRYVLPKGFIGVLYSYVYDKNGKMFFMFYDQNKKPYYIKYNPSSGEIDLSILKEQGAKSDLEISSATEKKNVDYYLKNYAVPIIIFIGIVSIAKN